MRSSLAFGYVISALLLLGGCPMPQAPPPAAAPAKSAPAPSDDDADYSTSGAPLERDPPSLDELATGHTFRDIYKPAQLSCDEWKGKLKEAKGNCARELWVEICGEKDDEGKPTGQYYRPACPACETLIGMESQASAQGCPT